jgi:hypothetical protein
MIADELRVELVRAYVRGGTDVIDSIAETCLLLRAGMATLSADDVIEALLAGLSTTRDQLEAAAAGGEL